MAEHTSQHAPVPPIDVSPTIPALLRRAVAEFGSDPLVITADRQLTFTDVDQESRRMALRLLAEGVGKASRVAFLLPQGPEWIITFLAATRIGAVAIPLSTFFTPTEARGPIRLGDVSHLVVAPTLLGQDMHSFTEEIVEGLSRASSPRLFFPELPFLRSIIVYGRSERPWAGSFDPARSAPVDARDAALLDAVESEVVPADHMVTMFTSGMTSGPKGVVHTHGAQLRHVANIVGLRSMKRGDRFFAVSPFFWVGGLTFQVLPALYFGGSLVSQERFEPASALDLIEKTRPNLYLGWANALARLRDDPSFGTRDLTGVAWLATPPADPSRYHNSLGMTETSGSHAIAPADEITRVLPDELRGSFGSAVPQVQHKVVDPVTNEALPAGAEGEICIRGYSVMVGYVKREREDTFDADGWFHTGDHGYFRDGYLFFTGRAGDMIKTAGSNVSPREVEDVLGELPEIRVGLAIGIPDAQRGEIVTVAIVPHDGAEVDSEGIRSDLRSKLSSYKVPRDPAHIQLFEVGQIPMINETKPDRKVARELVAERLGRQLP